MFKYLLFAVLLIFQGTLSASRYVDFSKAGLPPAPKEGVTVLKKSKGAELLKEWNTSFHSHGTHKTEAGKKAKLYSKCDFTSAGVKFTTSAELAKLKAPNGAHIYFSARLLTHIKLTPDMAGKNISYRFSIRGKRYNTPTSNHLLSGFIFTGTKVNRNVQAAMTGSFANHTSSALVPQGATGVVVFMALYGCGELEISEAEVTVSNTVPTGADVIVTSTGFIDQQFHIPADAPFPLYMIFKRQKKQYIKQASLEIELPEGYFIVGSSRPFELPARVNKGKFTINALGALRRTITDGAFCPWRPQMLLMLSKRKADTAFHEMKYTLIVEGKRQQTHTLKLRTCEFEKSRTPKLLGSGLQFPYGHDVDRNTAELLAQTYLKCGFNIWADNSSKELADLMKSRKVSRISSPYQLRNGYHIQGNPPLQGEECFLDINGKPCPRHICPVSVYKKSAYYKSAVTKMIEDAVGPQGKLDEILTNWEPYYLDYKGCFCSRCAAEFARYIKQPLESVKKDWPGKIIPKYGSTWVAFRSWQHGQVVKTLAETIKVSGAKDGGKRAAFIPEISHYGFTEFMSDRFTAQYHARDYLKYLDKICVWGPYTYKGGIKTRFLYTPAHHLGYFLTYRGVDKFIKKHSPKTRFHALPHGSHCGWVSTPESIVFDTLSGFVHNAVQSTPYWFYYDYRYHREMARMNTLLAEYEHEITSWKKSSQIKVVPTTPIITPRHWKGVYSGTPTANMFPEIFSEQAVQAIRWSAGKKSVAAVANIWEKEGVFVKLSFPDIKEGKWILKSEFPQEDHLCTAEELQQGVELFLPPLSWRFFRLLPFDKKLLTGRQITRTQITQLKEKLLPALKKAYAFEEKLLSSRSDDFPEYDFGALPEVRSANVSATGTRLNGAQAVSIKTPLYTALLDPAKGGRLYSFKVRGKEILSPTSESGLGLPACWLPFRRTIPRQMHLAAVTPEKNGVRVELRHPADTKTPFSWQVTWHFSAAGIRETFTITNTAKTAVKVMARFHNMLSEPSRNNAVSFIMGGRKVKLPLECSLARIAPADDSADKLFNVSNYWQGAETVLFPRSGVDFKASGLYACYFWNSPGAAAGSFEPTFTPVTVGPGKSVTVAQEWSVR